MMDADRERKIRQKIAKWDAAGQHTYRDRTAREDVDDLLDALDRERERVEALGEAAERMEQAAVSSRPQDWCDALDNLTAVRKRTLQRGGGDDG